VTYPHSKIIVQRRCSDFVFSVLASLNLPAACVSVNDDGMEGKFMGTNKVAGAKLVVGRQGEVNMPAGLGKRRMEKRIIVALITGSSNLPSADDS